MTRITTFAVLAAGLALSACGGSSGGGEQGSAPTAEKLLAELPAPYNMADVNNGRVVFVQCTACHTAVKGGANMVGPNLYGVFGLKAGTTPASFGFSDQLKAADITWNATTLDHWVEDPMAMVSGTKMAFVGVKNPKDRIDLVGYLKVVTSGGPQ